MTDVEVDYGAHADAELGYGLPPGQHPLDRSGGIEYNPGGSTEAAPARRGVAPFSTPNGRAIPVYQRAAEQGAEQAFTVNSTSGSVTLCGRVPGRLVVTIWVPSTASQGVQWSYNRATVDIGLGLVLSPGDSYSSPCEAPIYAAPIAGQSTGTVYVADLYNPSSPVVGT